MFIRYKTGFRGPDINITKYRGKYTSSDILLGFDLTSYSVSLYSI